jgi:WD40 repeat protein
MIVEYRNLLQVSSVGDYCFSGGVDGTVRCWNLPPPSVDPYDTFDASVMFAVFEGKGSVRFYIFTGTGSQSN